MSNYRTEVNIPVSKDSRTFEQQRKDMLSNLEQTYQIQSNVRSSSTTSSRKTENCNTFDNPNLNDDDLNIWDKDVHKWIQNSRSKWNENMNKMRQSMFDLKVKF